MKVLVTGAHGLLGRSLLQEIRRRYPGRAANGTGHDIHLLPVLVVSGQVTDDEDVVQALHEGGDDFVRKPLSFDDRGIGAKIHRCLRRSGRSDHGACDAAAASAAGGSGRHDQAFSWTADYAEVSLNGEVYLFTGYIQRNVIRILHQAADNDQPWQSGKVVLDDAGSTDVKMRNLFRRHPGWGTLIVSNGHGLYRLGIA